MPYNLKQELAKPERFVGGHRLCAGCGAGITVRAVYAPHSIRKIKAVVTQMRPVVWKYLFPVSVHRMDRQLYPQCV